MNVSIPLTLNKEWRDTEKTRTKVEVVKLKESVFLLGKKKKGVREKFLFMSKE